VLSPAGFGNQVIRNLESVSLLLQPNLSSRGDLIGIANNNRNDLSLLSTGHQVVIKRSATRDLFWIRLKVIATGAEFLAIANHWLSRSSG